VHVPTTLLGQVDAAIGGKTGVNVPEGKNLVGAFHQPVAVLADVDTLQTLPEAELRSGLAEVAKHGFIADPGLGDEMIAEREAIFARDPAVLTGMVARAAKVKVDIVERDETEAGERAHLNYGHTLGHALETAGSYDLHHGEAVAIGLIFAAELARELGRIDDGRVAYHREVVGRYDLPMQLPPGADVDALVTLMRRDKKAVAGLTFALDGPNGVEVVEGVESAIVESALRKM